jgi:hypothetical protein
MLDPCEPTALGSSASVTLTCHEPSAAALSSMQKESGDTMIASELCLRCEGWRLASSSEAASLSQLPSRDTTLS